MPAKDNAPASGTPAQGSTPDSSAPYAVVLAKAFDKLTSQVLIFLLAYVILLIGLAVFGSQLATTFRHLLYVIPLLGVAAFLFDQRHRIVKEGREKGVDVKARRVSGSASVIGVRGATGDLPDNVTLKVGHASDRAVVHGVEYAGATARDDGQPEGSDARFLVETFQQLNKTNRRELIVSAQRMLGKQEAAGG